MVWLMTMPVETLVRQRSSLCPHRSLIGDTRIKIYGSAFSIADGYLPVLIENIPVTPSKDTSYKVQVSIANLNIRKGPGTNYDRTGQFTGKGIFTIVQETKGEGATLWGKLKSGSGWISLDFAKKL